MSVALKRFVDEHVDLTGLMVDQCVFDGCVIELWRRAGHTRIANTFFANCRFAGDGWSPLFILMGKHYGDRPFTVDSMSW